MRSSCARAALPWKLFGLAFAWLVAPAVAGATSPAIIRVEEDWELVVETSDADSVAPQVSCVISPLENLNGVHAVLNLNHQTLPQFVGGGVQLQLWQPGETASFDNLQPGVVMSASNETVTWTQSMSLANGQLTFAVTAGSSQTWGAFPGAGEDLSLSVASNISSLGEYSPDVSVENSGVGYAGNRVTRLRLKEVRWYSASGLVARDTDARDVHTNNNDD